MILSFCEFNGKVHVLIKECSDVRTNEIRYPEFDSKDSYCLVEVSHIVAKSRVYDNQQCYISILETYIHIPHNYVLVDCFSKKNAYFQ